MEQYLDILAQKLSNRYLLLLGMERKLEISHMSPMLLMPSKNDVSVSNKVFNVGSGGTYSINRLVNLIGGKVMYIPKALENPIDLCDITKIKVFRLDTKVSLKMVWKVY